MSSLDGYVMREKVEKCLEKMRLVLGSNKANTFATADKVNHRYDDKYMLAEYLTNTSAACYWNALSHLGLSAAHQSVLQQWALTKDISLRFTREEECKFVEKRERDEDDPTRVETKLGLGVFTTKVITRVTEYVFLFSVTYTVAAFTGVGENPQEYLVLTERSAEQEVVTRNNISPYKESSRKEEDLNISWLVRGLDQSGTMFEFAIDRASDKCFTPRQNEQIEQALYFSVQFSQWSGRVAQYFLASLFPVQTAHSQVRIDFALLNADSVFNPVVPLLEEAGGQIEGVGVGGGSEEAVVLHGRMRSGDTSEDADPSESQSAVIPPAVANVLLSEQSRSLQAKMAQVEEMLGEGSAIVTAREGKIVVALKHISAVAVYYRDAVDFIENVVRAQLVAALGKEVTATDFAAYMVFHNRRVMREAFRPTPFSHAVRRSAAHSPEGAVKIQLAQGSGGSAGEPIFTLSKCIAGAGAGMGGMGGGGRMEFALNASTTVQFGGDRHLHGWMAHHFSAQPLPQLSLVASSRQFSSFVVLIGRIASSTLFLPQHAFIAQNRDEFTIPLDLERIPSAQEFKESIESLSPEQRRFAQAFRSMQLESTLFAVCVVQIKPQLERVLRLSPDSLTKEIKLTQDLMQLFIKYQIPSDLLAFDDFQVGGGGEGAGASVSERLTAVKANVAAIHGMLEQAKRDEVDARVQERQYRDGRRGGDSDDESEEMELSSQELKGEARSFGAKKKAGFGGFVRGGGMSFGAASAPVMSGFGGGGGASFGGAAMMRGSGGPPPPPCAPSFARSSVPLSLPDSSGVSTARMMSVQRSQPEQPQEQQEQQPQGPEQVQQEGQRLEQGQGQQGQELGMEGGLEGAGDVDFTKYPPLLDSLFEALDPHSSIRPTIINPGKSWAKSSQQGLLGGLLSGVLGGAEQQKEKEAAFDLLDALTRSGALPIEDASLHVVMACTHCFDSTLLDTIVQRNVNPIERVERSTLIMASALHGVAAREMLGPSQLARVTAYSPMLFDA
ncbi:hypothetical protein B484DRAFT_397165 [Ochromonadaceae sp. CCMP2298]|nr:hypothetical protein B484DRAFT_397165 [Ochromonadaceae sp. CCMP2298]